MNRLMKIVDPDHVTTIKGTDRTYSSENHNEKRNISAEIPPNARAAGSDDSSCIRDDRFHGGESSKTKKKKRKVTRKVAVVPENGIGAHRAHQRTNKPQLSEPCIYSLPENLFANDEASQLYRRQMQDSVSATGNRARHVEDQKLQETGPSSSRLPNRSPHGPPAPRKAVSQCGSNCSSSPQLSPIRSSRSQSGSHTRRNARQRSASLTCGIEKSSPRSARSPSASPLTVRSIARHESAISPCRLTRFSPTESLEQRKVRQRSISNYSRSNRSPVEAPHRCQHIVSTELRLTCPVEMIKDSRRSASPRATAGALRINEHDQMSRSSRSPSNNRQSGSARNTNSCRSRNRCRTASTVSSKPTYNLFSNANVPLAGKGSLELCVAVDDNPHTSSRTKRSICSPVMSSKRSSKPRDEKGSGDRLDARKYKSKKGGSIQSQQRFAQGEAEDIGDVFAVSMSDSGPVDQSKATMARENMGRVPRVQRERSDATCETALSFEYEFDSEPELLIVERAQEKRLGLIGMTCRSFRGDRDVNAVMPGVSFIESNGRSDRSVASLDIALARAEEADRIFTEIAQNTSAGGDRLVKSVQSLSHDSHEAANSKSSKMPFQQSCLLRQESSRSVSSARSLTSTQSFNTYFSKLRTRSQRQVTPTFEDITCSMESCSTPKNQVNQVRSPTLGGKLPSMRSFLGSRKSKLSRLISWPRSSDHFD